MKVLLAQEIAPDGIEYLKEQGLEVVLAPDEQTTTIQRCIRDCDGVISKTLMLTEEILQCAPQLRVIGKHGVGVDNVVDVEVARKLGIWVVNTPMANANSVAEHTVGYILALSRHLREMDQAVRAGNFDYPSQVECCEVEGKCLGIIGLGRIGQSVAKKCSLGLGMQVLGYDPYLDESKVPDFIRFTGEMEEIFRQSDFITLHIPYTPDTHHLVDARKLSLMKKSAFLINCARGGIVDEEALCQALEQKRIAGAGIDCFAHEPLSQDDPLLRAPGVMATPHSAALTREAMARMSYGAAKGVAQVLLGQPVEWCVNRGTR
ncbi:MAG: hydroxyacid dehydrogenase [Eubacteriales bacterium]|jgi:D-3-phosphoglycerate dehydrogenase